MRCESILPTWVIHAINIPIKIKSEGLKKLLMSHPFLLPDQLVGSSEFFGPIIAETQMFSFEFGRQVGPNDSAQQPGYLNSLWKESS